MKAYMFIKTKVTDREQYIKYVKAAQPLAEQGGRKFLVRSRPVEVLEETAETVDDGDYYLMVSEWPSVESAREFWNSDEYEAVRKLREAAGEVNVVLAEQFLLSTFACVSQMKPASKIATCRPPPYLKI